MLMKCAFRLRFQNFNRRPRATMQQQQRLRTRCGASLASGSRAHLRYWQAPPALNQVHSKERIFPQTARTPQFTSEERGPAVTSSWAVREALPRVCDGQSKSVTSRHGACASAQPQNIDAGAFAKQRARRLYSATDMCVSCAHRPFVPLVLRPPSVR